MTKTLAVIICLTSSLVLAQSVPGSITFNARLTDTGGTPITGSHALGFGLYDTGSGGAALWTENVSGASFSDDGLAFVELGTVTPLTPAALDGRRLYLEVSVDGTTMSPRLGIVSVPYAIRASVAATAGSIGNLTVATIQQRVSGACNAGQAVRSIDATGAVQCENIAAGGGDVTEVTTAAGSGLTGGNTTGAVALSLATCGSGEVLKSNGTGWACAADDSGAAYAAGTGLSLTSGTFAVDFGGNGAATAAARADHTHNDGVPAGAVMYFAGAACPAGWVLANGSTESRTGFPALFAAIGTTYGAPGASTFTLPDLRGEFIRSLDNGRGVDTGRTLAAPQAQDFKSFSMQNTGGPSNGYTHGPYYFPKSGMNGNLFGGYWSAPAGLIGLQWDSSEVRPRNMALNACIKT